MSRKARTQLASIEAEARAQALSEAYDLLFDVKGCKATKFDAQKAIRELAAPVDVQAWIKLARVAGGIFAPENAHLFTKEAALKAFAHVKQPGES